MKRLRDIQGPAKAANTFIKGEFGIVVRVLFYLPTVLQRVIL